MMQTIFFFRLQEIPISPFRIKVDPSHDANKVRAEGPGLCKIGTYGSASVCKEVC